MGDYFKNPAWLLAALVGSACVLAAVIWAGSYLVPAIGAAFGYAAAGIIHGAVSGTVAGWFAGVAVYAATAIVAGGAVATGIRAVDQARAKPFAAVAVMLAACQGLLVDMVKDLWPGDAASKWFVKALAALFFVVAAALWDRGGWRLRAGSVLVCTIFPATVLSLALGPHLRLGVRDALAHVDTRVWFTLGAFLISALAVVAIARLLRPIDKAAPP